MIENLQASKSAETVMALACKWISMQLGGGEGRCLVGFWVVLRFRPDFDMKRSSEEGTMGSGFVGLGCLLLLRVGSMDVDDG
jgi:hypothetical protein